MQFYNIDMYLRVFCGMIGRKSMFYYKNKIRARALCSVMEPRVNFKFTKEVLREKRAAVLLFFGAWILYYKANEEPRALYLTVISFKTLPAFKNTRKRKETLAFCISNCVLKYSSYQLSQSNIRLRLLYFVKSKK